MPGAAKREGSSRDSQPSACWCGGHFPKPCCPNGRHKANLTEMKFSLVGLGCLLKADHRQRKAPLRAPGTPTSALLLQNKTHMQTAIAQLGLGQCSQGHTITAHS